MEITPFGYIFLSVCLLGLFLPVRYLFAVTLFSCIFQATSACNFTFAGAVMGIPPWVAGFLFLVLKSFFISSPRIDFRKDRFIRCVTCFVIFAISASLLYPHFGWDIQQPVFDMITEGRRSISFGVGHITQISYIILFFLSIYSIYRNRAKFSNEFVEKIFITSIIAVCLIGFWEFTSKTTGTDTFPYSFFYNNLRYSQLYMSGSSLHVMRLNSTFTEASCCGGFLAASFWAIMSMDKLKYKWLSILIGLALILNLSGTGIVSFIAGIPIFLYFKNKWKYLLWMTVTGLILAFIIYEMDYAEYIINMVINKQDSTSGYQRGAAAWYSWEVFLKTWGIGVGLGGLRGGSFLLSMLASLGIIGTILFGRIYYYLFKHSEDQSQWLSVYALVLLVAQTTSLPDFANSSMWIYFFMAAVLLPQKMIDNPKVLNLTS